MFLRTILVMLLSRFGRRQQFHDVGRLRRVVLPNDLDVLGHMNNGVYFSVMDLGRLELSVRSGAWRLFSKNGWYPVAGSETMTFRRSLQPWQRYTLESRVVGYDDKAMYVQQRFVVGGEVYAEGLVRGRFVRKSGGTVAMKEFGEVIGVDTAAMPVSEWMLRWAADVTLPPARATFTSDW
ncbi:MAG: thioesterase [Glaciihabitans sp.]|jgi:acyl-CoA thioesterase FadM|nr:thioesterase [Glaciihabitans sp.]